MTYFVIPSRRTRQPQGAVRVDWNNPLARELRLLWTGSAARELVGNVALSKTGTVSNIASSSGLGIQAAADSYLSIPTRNSLEISADITCLVIVKPVTVSGDASFFAKTTTNGGSNSPFSFNSHNAGLALNRANTGYRVWASGTESLAAGKESVVAVTQGGDIGVAPRFYYNGAFDTAAASSIFGGGASGNAFASGTDVFLCNRNDGSTDYDGSLILAAAWARVLSDAEIAALSANPWQLFADPRRIYFGASGGGATIITTSGAASLVARAAAAVTATKIAAAASRATIASTASTTSIRTSALVAKANSAGAAATTTIRTATIAARTAGTGTAATTTLRTGLAAGRLVGGSTTTYAAIVAGAFAAAGRTSARGTAAYTSTHAATAAASATTHGEASATTLRDGIAAARLDARAAVTAAALVAGTVTTSAAAQIGARASVSNTTERSAALAAMLALRGANPAAPELPVIVPPSTRTLSPDHTRLGLSPVAPAKPRLG